VLTESGGGEEWKGQWRKQLGIVYKREEKGEMVTGMREGKENLRQKIGIGKTMTLRVEEKLLVDPSIKRLDGIGLCFEAISKG
jgi:hypothetical protein